MLLQIKEWGIDGLSNPVPRVTVKTSNNARDRRLHGEEEQLLMVAAREYGGNLEAIIRFALETTMRRGEIAAMRWGHLEKGGRVLIVPDTKNGDPRMVPLSTTAAGILRDLPRRIDGKVWGVRADSTSPKPLTAPAAAPTSRICASMTYGMRPLLGSLRRG